MTDVAVSGPTMELVSTSLEYALFVDAAMSLFSLPNYGSEKVAHPC